MEVYYETSESPIRRGSLLQDVGVYYETSRTLSHWPRPRWAEWEPDVKGGHLILKSFRIYHPDKESAVVGVFGRAVHSTAIRVNYAGPG